LICAVDGDLFLLNQLNIIADRGGCGPRIKRRDVSGASRRRYRVGNECGWAVGLRCSTCLASKRAAGKSEVAGAYKDTHRGTIRMAGPCHAQANTLNMFPGRVPMKEQLNTRNSSYR